MKIKPQVSGVILSGKTSVLMIRVLGFSQLLVLCLWLPQAMGEDSPKLLCRPNFDYGLIRVDYPEVFIEKGKSKLDTVATEFIASEISIQVSKIKELLGIELDHNAERFSVVILEQDELLSLSDLDGAGATTVDGVMNFSKEEIRSEIIRHEVFHSMIFKLVGSKLPWWIEEGLAQILSGELYIGKIEKPRTETEIKYHEARLKVSGLLSKCGFKPFGSYIELIEQGNTERYAYNKIFNEGCGHE